MNFKHDRLKMIFVHTLHILIVVLTRNKEKCHAQYVIGLKNIEPVHLSRPLNPPEHLRLIKGVCELSQGKVEREKQIHEVLNENLDNLSTSTKACFIDLIQRSNDYPKTKESGRRSTMEIARKLLKYPKFAKYMKENRRSINLLDSGNYALADTLEFPERKMLRRHTSKNNKHLPIKGKKKKRTNQDHSGHSMPRHKRIHGAIDTSSVQATVPIRLLQMSTWTSALPAMQLYHFANTTPKTLGFIRDKSQSHKNRKLKKKENKLHNKKNYLKQHKSFCISITFILLFISLCLIAAYYLYIRSRVKARGTRFKYNWNGNKEDKDTLTDNVEWNDEVECSCSDVNVTCTGKCPFCNQIYDVFDTSNKYMNSIGVQKGKDKPKKKRFNFLQKSFQDKKKRKDLENRDRKKIVEKAVSKKRQKYPTAFKGDQQCECCKCSTDTKSADKMIRERKENEKKILYKLKAKKRKEKKRRKDEIRKAEKYANICFRDTCK